MIQLYRRFMERLSRLIPVEPSAAWRQLSQGEQDQLLAKVNFNPIAFGAFMMVAQERDLTTAARAAKAHDKERDLAPKGEPMRPEDTKLLSPTVTTTLEAEGNPNVL